MQETDLHADLKRHLLRAGGSAEVQIDGFLIDLVTDGLLLEIQTRNFSAMKNKLADLIPRYPLRVVHPISRDLWIILRDKDGMTIHRRKSPRRGRLEFLFYELVHVAEWIDHPNFSLQVLLISEEQERVRDGTGSWRRRGVRIHNRRLMDIYESYYFLSPSDYRIFLPFPPDFMFSNAELADQLSISTKLAAKMTYSLIAAGLLGKSRIGRANQYWLINSKGS